MTHAVMNHQRYNKTSQQCETCPIVTDDKML